MLRIYHKKAQAVTELAVFGAILIYLLGTIIRTAVGNSITQNENYKVMRMAMLASWQGSLKGNISHNSASILLVEDRLSPDFTKYGDLDRSPYIANGGGTFSYELLYPLTPGQDNMQSQMPIMDVYINGQHFPFATSLYVTNKILLSPSDGYPVCSGVLPGGPILVEPPIVAQQQCLANGNDVKKCQQVAQAQCNLNQCLRYRREWVGSYTTASNFNNVILPATAYDPTCTGLGSVTDQHICQSQINGGNILAMLEQPPNALIDTPAAGQAGSQSQWMIDPTQYPSQWSAFEARYKAEYSTYFRVPPYPVPTNTELNTQLANIKSVLNHPPTVQGKYSYKIFYTMVANDLVPGAAQAAPVYSVNPPTCALHPCKNAELSGDLTLSDAYGSLSNSSGDLMFDLQRLNIPQGQPYTTVVPTGLRPYMAWQWAATAGTTAGMIGLNTSNNEFPSYDIDGRLKEVTIYSISCCTSGGEPTVSYSDPQLGDIDGGWDTNSCAPKPGLQSDAQVYTFTQNGTYLLIKEGQLLNPESGQVVRSQTKRDTIDLIQRSVQLSNDTKRFCNGATPQPCIDYSTYNNSCVPPSAHGPNPYGADPNPVEVCVAQGEIEPSTGKAMNCFSNEMNIKSTCFDENSNMLYVRSRIQDLRGHLWITDTSGQLKVQL